MQNLLSKKTKMKCIFCKLKKDVRNVRMYGETTKDMDGVCLKCLKGLNKQLNKFR